MKDRCYVIQEKGQKNQNKCAGSTGGVESRGEAGSMYHPSEEARSCVMSRTELSSATHVKESGHDVPKQANAHNKIRTRYMMCCIIDDICLDH